MTSIVNMSNDFIIKILTLGDSCVGKTSIILRYTKTPFPKIAFSTIGVDFRSRTISLDNKKRVKIFLWDTAAQERYRNVASNYYNGTDCVLLVFDITSVESFTILDYWVQQLEERNRLDDICMILVGNKSDIKNKPTVSKNDINEFISKYGIQYFEVSAMKDEGIEELFNYAIKETMKIIGKREANVSNLTKSSRLTDTEQHEQKEKVYIDRKFKCC